MNVANCKRILFMKSLIDVMAIFNYKWLSFFLLFTFWEMFAVIMQVRVNDPRTQPEHFSTGFIGKDNAIARHGIHGLYRQYSAELPSHLFVRGRNTIYLRQAKATGPFQGIMYDYIRLERPELNSRTWLFRCVLLFVSL